MAYLYGRGYITRLALVANFFFFINRQKTTRCKQKTLGISPALIISSIVCTQPALSLLLSRVAIAWRKIAD